MGYSWVPMVGHPGLYPKRPVWNQLFPDALMSLREDRLQTQGLKFVFR